MSRAAGLPSRSALAKTGRGRVILAAAVVILLAIVLSPFRLAMVVGDSMRPGLKTGDLLVVNKWAYHNTDPRRGDVVLARYRNEIIVKRIVGLPGEEVKVSGGNLYINGSEFPEPYPIQPGPLELGSGTLRWGKYALVGDNRAVSREAGIHAVLPTSELIGKIVWVLHLRKRAESGDRD